MSIETPSGKDAKDENFPVGSFLLPKKLRPHIARYYAFARTIDDIADNPALSADEKIRRLDAMDDAVQGKKSTETGLETAIAMHGSLVETRISPRHCSDLIVAFRQDAVKNRYKTWDELVNYCMHSASPVGRYLLDLHGEAPEGYVYSDALCNALQVINHLQDCADDHGELDRVYLPEPWLTAAGASVQDLARATATPGLRTVLDQCLEGTRTLLETADKLPAHLKNRPLSMESAIIIEVAHKLVDALSTRDPLAERVVLSKPQYGLCALKGMLKGGFS